MREKPKSFNNKTSFSIFTRSKTLEYPLFEVGYVSFYIYIYIKRKNILKIFRPDAEIFQVVIYIVQYKTQ